MAPANPNPLPAKFENKLLGLEEALANKNQLAIAEYNKNLSLPAILDGEKTQISWVKRNNPEQIDRLLKLLILNFTKSFSVSNNMTSDQIYEVVAEILVNYWHLTVEDISYFLNCVKRGEYGTIYSLDSNKLISWLKEYDLKRTDMISQQRMDEQYALTAEPAARDAERIMEGWDKHRLRRKFDNQLKSEKEKKEQKNQQKK